MEFAYKRLTNDNIGDLQSLFRIVFKKKISRASVIKKYDNSLNNGKYLGFLAYNQNNQPIGFHGATFYELEYKNETYTVAQGGDSMTHPRYQGKGLFTNLGKIMQALAAEEGILFLYGFPNQNSYPGYIKKLDWKFTGKMKCYTIQVKCIPFENIFRKFGLNSLNRIRFKRATRHLKSLTPILRSSVINKEYGGVKRDYRFYRYKSYSNNHTLEIEGCKVWLKIHGAMLIGDIENFSEDVKMNVLSTLKKIALKIGVQKIIFQTSPNTHIDQFLSKEYEAVETFPIGFYDIKSPIPLDKLNFTYGDLDTF